VKCSGKTRQDKQQKLNDTWDELESANQKGNMTQAKTATNKF